MTDEETEASADDGQERDERVTSPMQPFGSTEITIGIVVLLVGLALTFALPFVF